MVRPSTTCATISSTPRTTSTRLRSPSRRSAQNDFGGTFGGPIIEDKTFSFFPTKGYEVSLPQIASGQFYSVSARAAVAPVYRPFINALPLPDPNAPLIDPTCDNITNPCQANIVAAYSNPSSLDAISIRIDHHLTRKINLFARYSHAPSYDATRTWEEVGVQQRRYGYLDRGRHCFAHSSHAETTSAQTGAEAPPAIPTPSPTFMAR